MPSSAVSTSNPSRWNSSRIHSRIDCSSSAIRMRGFSPSRIPASRLAGRGFLHDAWRSARRVRALGKRDAEDGAAARSRLDVDVAVVVGDDAMDDGQAEAGALAERAAERLEDRVDVLGRNADAFVFDAAARASVRARASSRTRAQAQRAAVRHRAQAVGGEVPDDLADLPFVGLDHHRRRRTARTSMWWRSSTSVLLRSSIAVSCTIGRRSSCCSEKRCGRA